jgi:hypothetical protein
MDVCLLWILLHCIVLLFIFLTFLYILTIYISKYPQLICS